MASESDAAREQIVTTYNPRNIDYLGHLARESALFGHALDGAAADARVPTCPDWNADDLLWHLGEVQWFWGTIVREDVDADGAEALKPVRPDTRPALMDFFLTVSGDLGKALGGASPQTPAWTWSDDHTVGFIIRRQAHEALIHRVDAELTAGQRRSLMDPALSADGVDEVLRIMYGGDPPAWGTFAAEDAASLRLQALDTGDSWHITLGQFTGTDPDSGNSYDQLAIAVAGADSGDDVAATVRGTADDLDCLLWQRPIDTPLERFGDREVLGRFDRLIAEGIQ
ncbi:MAG: maleylpyruvate isomerase N-terminal domain-containing protein [Streptosporangiaceae bacterium]